MNKNAKGLIALDIDGTITSGMEAIPSSVIEFLGELSQQGWQFVFITGRTFDFGYRLLQALPFNYYYAVQNGAILFSMPEKIILLKKYLNRSIIPVMETICAEEPTDFVIYAGFELNNLCFFRKAHFSDTLLKYLEARRLAFHEEWRNLNSFDQLPIADFPSIKCFGELTSAYRLAQNIEKRLGLHVPMIKDPFCENYYVVQATDAHVTKGEVLKDLVRMGCTGPNIAAGDDLNDLSMFQEAHIKIAMENAPLELKEKADIIAPPAAHQGIIIGLKRALEIIRRGQ